MPELQDVPWPFIPDRAADVNANSYKFDRESLPWYRRPVPSITADNVADYAAADAYVVGSWLKAGGLWTSPPDPARCDALRAAVDGLPGR